MAVIGVPVAVFGWWLWRKGKRNIALMEAAYAQYLATLAPVAGRSASREHDVVSAFPFGGA